MILDRLLLIVVSTLFFFGCSASNPSSKPFSENNNSVIVERGPVFEATVKDANGQVATQVKGKNVYEFNNSIVYPISVSGGWIDLDGDKNKTEQDINLDINLTSYTNTVTPITTLLSNEDKNKRKYLEDKLIEKFGINKEDLYKLPSNANVKLASLTNAIFKEIKEQNTTIEKLFTYDKIFDEKEQNVLKSLEEEFDTIEAIAESSDAMENGIFDPLKLERHIVTELKKQKENISVEVSDSIHVGFEDEGLESPETINEAGQIEGVTPSLEFYINKISGAIPNPTYYTHTKQTYGMADLQNIIINDPTTIDENGFITRTVELGVSQPQCFQLNLLAVTNLLEDFEINNAYNNGGGNYLLVNGEGLTSNSDKGIVSFQIKYHKNLKGKNFSFNLEGESNFDIGCGIQAGISRPLITSLTFDKSYGVNLRDINSLASLWYETVYDESNGESVNYDGWVLPTNNTNEFINSM